MSEPEREFRVEWHLGDTLSCDMKAMNAAEAVEKAKKAEDDDVWHLTAQWSRFIALPAASPISSVISTTGAEAEAAKADHEDMYCVSRTCSSIYGKNVFATDSEAACRKVSESDVDWKELADAKTFAAQPFSDFQRRMAALNDQEESEEA